MQAYRSLAPSAHRTHTNLHFASRSPHSPPLQCRPTARLPACPQFPPPPPPFHPLPPTTQTYISLLAPPIPPLPMQAYRLPSVPTPPPPTRCPPLLSFVVSRKQAPMRLHPHKPTFRFSLPPFPPPLSNAGLPLALSSHPPPPFHSLPPTALLAPPPPQTYISLPHSPPSNRPTARLPSAALPLLLSKQKIFRGLQCRPTGVGEWGGVGGGAGLPLACPQVPTSKDSNAGLPLACP